MSFGGGGHRLGEKEIPIKFGDPQVISKHVSDSGKWNQCVHTVLLYIILVYETCYIVFSFTVAERRAKMLSKTSSENEGVCVWCIENGAQCSLCARYPLMGPIWPSHKSTICNFLDFDIYNVLKKQKSAESLEWMSNNYYFLNIKIVGRINYIYIFFLYFFFENIEL